MKTLFQLENCTRYVVGLNHLWLKPIQAHSQNAKTRRVSTPATGMESENNHDRRADQCILSSNCLYSISMSASFFTVSSFSGNDIVKHFCVTVSYQRITSLAQERMSSCFLSWFSCISCSFKTLKNFPMKVTFTPSPPSQLVSPPLASMITFFTSSGCKLCFLFPDITHSQETKNHNKRQFHLLVFSDDRMISKETEKQNEVRNQSRNF